MYPENPEGTQVIVGSMNMGYIFDTARNQTHNLFCPKWELIQWRHFNFFLGEKFFFTGQLKNWKKNSTLYVVI